MSRLNGNPFLSKDRLTKVKDSIYFNNSDDSLNAANSIETHLLGLGSNCDVYFVHQVTTTQSSIAKAVGKRKRKKASKARHETCIQNGGDNGTWWIGRVQKMRKVNKK